jgi:hypothetical protein
VLVWDKFMASFSTTLVSGGKRPYESWTFVVVPDHMVAGLGSKRPFVRGTINDVSFRGTVSRGEGVYRMPVPRDLQRKAQIACGDKVRVFMEIDTTHRRGWATHIAEAKRVETRIRRASKAAKGIRNKQFPGT